MWKNKHRYYKPLQIGLNNFNLTKKLKERDRDCVSNRNVGAFIRGHLK
jgi:hypothetical protein